MPKQPTFPSYHSTKSTLLPKQQNAHPTIICQDHVTAEANSHVEKKEKRELKLNPHLQIQFYVPCSKYHLSQFPSTSLPPTASTSTTAPVITAAGGLANGAIRTRPLSIPLQNRTHTTPVPCKTLLPTYPAITLAARWSGTEQTEKTAIVATHIPTLVIATGQAKAQPAPVQS